MINKKKKKNNFLCKTCQNSLKCDDVDGLEIAWRVQLFETSYLCMMADDKKMKEINDTENY